MTDPCTDFAERAAIIEEGCCVSRERAEWMARRQLEQAAKDARDKGKQLGLDV